MAVEERLRGTYAEGRVQYYETYDTADGVFDAPLESYRVVWDVEPGTTVHMNLWRNSSQSPWRETDLTGQGEYSDTRPFGPVKSNTDLGVEVVVVYG